jgi:hypothetical protein
MGLYRLYIFSHFSSDFVAEAIENELSLAVTSSEVRDDGSDTIEYCTTTAVVIQPVRNSGAAFHTAAEKNKWR